MTASEPPRRFVYEEVWEAVEGEPPGRLASEFLVEAKSGGTCVVRLVSTLHADGDGWDEVLDTMHKGWRRSCSTCAPTSRTSRASAAPRSWPRGRASWAAFLRRLGLAGAGTGDRVRTADAPALAGTVEYRGERELMLRLSARARPRAGLRLRLAGDDAHDHPPVPVRGLGRRGGARGAGVARLDGSTLGRVSDYELPITTALELPGTVVRENLGIAFGLVVRSMGLSRNVTAAFSSLSKGEVPQYTELLEDARRHAIDRMVANAKLLGANAIVSMRFDSSEMGNGLTEVVAYGTAVVVDRAG